MTAVTSAPVSSLKIVGWVPTMTATFQAEGKSEVMQSRYAFSVISSVVIVEIVLEKHLALKCPLRWHLWQVASFAGYCSYLWDLLLHLPQCLCVRFSAVGLVGLLSGICTEGTALCAAFTASSVIGLLLLSPFRIPCCS